MKRWITFLSFAGALLRAQGSVWYVTNNATPAANGSITNPWSIYTALNATSSVQPGDTIYLRGGSYLGPAIFSTISGTSNNYVTVQSYSNEWAVITDGVPHVLQTSFTSNPTNGNWVVITGQPSLQPGGVQFVGIDGEQFMVWIGSGTNWEIIGGASGTTPTSHVAGTPVYMLNSFIEHSGSYVTFRDFEITASGATNRVVGVGTSNSLGGGLDLQASGQGNKAINLIIHNVGHPGIGFWSQGQGGEVNGCLLWGNGIYDDAGTWLRGDGVYAENVTNSVKMNNNIAFLNLDTGLKAYGTGIPVVGFYMSNNIVFGSPEASLQLSDQNFFTSNNWIVGNWVMGSPQLSYISTGNTQQYVISNTIVNVSNLMGQFTAKETTNSVYASNTIFMTQYLPYGDGSCPIGYQSALYNKSQLNIVWDYNTYYIGNGDDPYQWMFQTKDKTGTNSQGGGFEVFSNDKGFAWVNWSGFDAHSVCITNWPTNYLAVHAQQLDYDSNRWYIVVVSTSGQTNTTITPSSCGFNSGDMYQLVDAQNWPVIVSSGVYTNGTINLPLNLTNIAYIPGIVQSNQTGFVIQHTDVSNPGLFNAFVLRRIAGAQPMPPTDFHVISP